MENMNLKNNQLLDEAAEWIARLRSDQVSAADQQAFAVWLSQGIAQREAFDSIENLWQDLGVVQYLPDEALPAEQNVRPVPIHTNVKQGLPAFGRRALAAAAAIVVAVLLVWQMLPQAPRDASVFRTAIGEQKTVRLDDGSSLMLNTNTVVSVDFSTTRRGVKLQRGEAYFMVAKDSQRPFVVELGEVTVTAVGTAFNIHRQPRQALIIVTEGEVKVVDNHAQADAAAPTERVRANQQVVARKIEGLSVVTDTDVEQATAWQRQQLVFDGTRLSDVVAELNRYSTQQIRIADPLLNSLQVSGVFRLDDPQAALQGLEASLALEHVEQDGLILLYKKSL
ncbi:MAG: FecR family protein [Pseudomonadales bacterium]